MSCLHFRMPWCLGSFVLLFPCTGLLSIPPMAQALQFGMQIPFSVSMSPFTPLILKLLRMKIRCWKPRWLCLKWSFNKSFWAVDKLGLASSMMQGFEKTVIALPMLWDPWSRGMWVTESIVRGMSPTSGEWRKDFVQETKRCPDFSGWCQKWACGLKRQTFWLGLQWPGVFVITASPLTSRVWTSIVPPRSQVVSPVTPCRVTGWGNFSKWMKSSLFGEQEQVHLVSTIHWKQPGMRELECSSVKQSPTWERNGTLACMSLLESTMLLQVLCELRSECRCLCEPTAKVGTWWSLFRPVSRTRQAILLLLFTLVFRCEFGLSFLGLRGNLCLGLTFELFLWKHEQDKFWRKWSRTEFNRG